MVGLTSFQYTDQSLKLEATAATERFQSLGIEFQGIFIRHYRSYWETSTVIVGLTSVLYNMLEIDTSNLVEHLMKMKATWWNRLDN